MFDDVRLLLFFEDGSSLQIIVVRGTCTDGGGDD
jgi:hypothetical protein